MWVETFAKELADASIDVRLEPFGGQMAAFMEREVREADFVILICTPRYREKMNTRAGGVGYEGDVFAGEVLAHAKHEKFIPVLKEGSWVDAAPSALLGKFYCDLSSKGTYSKNFEAAVIDALRGSSREDKPLK